VRYVLTADHEIPERAPFVVRPGDVVQVGDRDTEWPAFVFVTATHGTGRVPARHIDINGSAGVVRTRYDTCRASRGVRRTCRGPCGRSGKRMVLVSER
jgi:hypothetical protein